MILGGEAWAAAELKGRGKIVGGLSSLRSLSLKGLRLGQIVSDIDKPHSLITTLMPVSSPLPIKRTWLLAAIS
jgi:hypothetical protein